MKVVIRTTSGQLISATDVTEVNLFWRNGSKIAHVSEDTFQKEFVLDKDRLRGITFKGKQTIFLDTNDIDYITSSNS